MRTCSASMTAHGGFVWPESGPVEAPDWDPEPCCGYGLHGLLWGAGDGSLLNWDASARWLVVEVEASTIVSLGEKVKFPRGVVLLVGDRKTVADYISARAPEGTKVNGGTASAGARGTASAGYGGTASAGYGGTASAGYGGTASAGARGTASAGARGTASAGDGGTASAGARGTASAGYGGTASAGYGGTASAGYGGTASAGDGGTASAGDGGTASAGARGTATAGYGGTASAGARGTATAGYGGTASAGDGGTASAGEDGIIILMWWDSERRKYRKVAGVIGEDGLEPNVAYVLDDAHRFVPAPVQPKAAMTTEDPEDSDEDSEDEDDGGAP